MRYLKGQHQRSQMPEINLIPMMDVIMTILTFFIIVAMTLTGIQSVDLSLPDVKDPEQTDAQNLPEPLVVELSRSQRLVVNGRSVSDAEVAAGIRQYLQQNPRGAVLLKADQQLPYRKVVEVLTRLKGIGGDRVSLAIEPV
jgi:biopolymer transport protein ExbD